MESTTISNEMLLRAPVPQYRVPERPITIFRLEAFSSSSTSLNEMSEESDSYDSDSIEDFQNIFTRHASKFCKNKKESWIFKVKSCLKDEYEGILYSQAR